MELTFREDHLGSSGASLIQNGGVSTVQSGNSTPTIDELLAVQYEGIVKTASSNAISSIAHDPVSIAARALSKYRLHKLSISETLSEEIKQMSKDIAEINRLWSNITTLCYLEVDQTDPKKTTHLMAGGTAGDFIKLDSLMMKYDPKGFRAASTITTVNFDQLTSASAGITAFCDSLQADLKKIEQDFQNAMSLVTSSIERMTTLFRWEVTYSKK